MKSFKSKYDKSGQSGQSFSKGSNSNSLVEEVVRGSLSSLLQASESERDDSWEQNFLRTFVESELKVVNESPQQGPDGFSYLAVEYSPTQDQNALKVINWLAERGIGLVLNPQKSVPDYVFTYGMLWSFKEFGYLSRAQQVRQNGDLVIEDGQKIFWGEPSQSYLPLYVRKLLREFFQQQGVLVPMVAMLSFDNKEFDFCWSLESLGSPPEKEHEGIANAISWFLPTDYSIALVEEKKIKTTGTKEFFKL